MECFGTGKRQSSITGDVGPCRCEDAWGVPVCGSVSALFLCAGRDVLVWFVCGPAGPGQCLDDRAGVVRGVMVGLQNPGSSLAACVLLVSVC